MFLLSSSPQPTTSCIQGHITTLKVTDPELIEVFDNFAFDEVPQYGDLDVMWMFC